MNDRLAIIEVSSNIRECNNLIDDDLDDLVDLADPGCTEGLDDSENNNPEELPECADGIDNDEDGLIDWPDDPQCVAAGDPEEALACELVDDVTVIPAAGGRFMTDTRNREDLYQGSCAGTRGGEQVFSLNLVQPANVTFEMVQADYDTAIFLRRICDDAMSQVACNDDGGVGTLSRIQQQLQPGEYFLFVDGFSNRSGTGTLQVTVQ
jgi:hypothetical protein